MQHHGYVHVDVRINDTRCVEVCEAEVCEAEVCEAEVCERVMFIQQICSLQSEKHKSTGSRSDAQNITRDSDALTAAFISSKTLSKSEIS